ncbi:Protein ETHYLENE INSENSITIVE 3 [Linum perenne]
MMMFEDMAFCGDMDFFSAPSLVGGEVDPVSAQPEPTMEDDYSDEEEIDVDELERRMWRDKMRLKKLKESVKNRSVKTIDHRSRLMVRLTEIGRFFHIFFSVGQRLRIFQGRLRLTDFHRFGRSLTDSQPYPYLS